MPSLRIQMVVAQDAFAGEAVRLQCFGERSGAARRQQHVDAVQADIVEEEGTLRLQGSLRVDMLVLQ